MIIGLAILLHVTAVYWSCAQPKKLVYEDARAGEVLENICIEKSITNSYIISWQTAETDTEVELFAGAEENEQEDFTLIERTNTLQLKINKKIAESPSSFQLVVPGKDTVTIPQIAVSPQ